MKRTPVVAIVCGRCEHEWDADKRAADAACPRCGYDPSFLNRPGEDHVVRANEAAPDGFRQDVRDRKGRYKNMAPCPRCKKRRELWPQTDPAYPKHLAYRDLCRKCEDEVKEDPT